MKMSALLFGLSLAFAAACGDDGAEQPKDASIDPPGMPDASCFDNPQTHAEIINACTTAQRVYKKPILPLRNKDGTLPLLPP
jgi:hypothetical protein